MPSGSHNGVLTGLLRRTGLRGRLIALVALVIAPLTAMILFQAESDKQSALELGLDHAALLAKLGARQQEDVLQQTQTLVEVLSDAALVRAADPMACTQFLRRNADRYAWIVNIIVATTEGEILCSLLPVPPATNLPSAPIFQAALAARGVVFSGFIKGQVSGRQTIVAAAALRDGDGAASGYIAAAVDLSWLGRFASETAAAAEATVSVIDGNGTVLARYPDPEAYVGHAFPAHPLTRAMLAQDEGRTTSQGFDGIERFHAFVRLAHTDARLAVGIPTAAVFVPAEQVLYRDIALLIAVTILSISAAWIGSDLLVLKPVRALVAAARRIAGGDWAAAGDVTQVGGEIGTLIHSFADMSERLSTRERELNSRTEDLTIALASAESSEKALTAIHAQLVEAQRMARIGSWERDLVGGVRIWSDETYRIFEINKGKFTPSHEAFLAAIHPDDRDAVDRAYRESVANRMPYEITHRLLMRDGRIKWVLERCETFYDDSGKPLRSVGTVQDITERERADAALRASEAEFRRLLSASPDAIIIVGATGHILAASDRVQTLFGYTAEELVGKPLGVLVPERHRDIHDRHLRHYMTEPTVRNMGSGLELTALRKDGSEFPTEISLSPSPTREGLTVTAAVRDITERKKIEAQLIQAQKMEAIGNLTGGLAHDFNNILGVILGNLDLLRGLKKGDRDVEELVGDAFDAANHGAELTRSLLAFASKQPLQAQRVDVNALITRMTQLFIRTFEENIEIKRELDEDVWPVVVDPVQLEASFANLATNARDAMPRGGQLLLKTSNRHIDADYAAQHAELTPGDYVMIELSDTGTGMPPVVKSHIFDPFFTTKPAGRGTGLGLSMVFGFIKQSRGHINVYSEVGAGTTFRLYLPRALESGAVSEPASVTAVRPGVGETVLAVEDNAALRRVVVRQLTEMGYRVLEAENAATALALLEHEAVDLLFSDIIMPGNMNGYELTKAALARWPTMKAVLTSGFPETKLNGHGGPPANLRLLVKPYQKEELARIIRDVLDE